MAQDPDWTLDRYLVEIRNQSNIPENEDELIRSARRGDQVARQALVKSYLALTAEIGIRLAPPKLTKLEAIQEANLVLLRVIDKGLKKPAADLGRAIEEHFAQLT